MPEGAKTLTLPNNSIILVFAMTASNNSNDETVPAGALYDEKTPPVMYPLTVNNGSGTGSYPEGVSATITATVPVGYIFKEWEGPVADPKARTTTVTIGTEPVTVTAVLTNLGANLAFGKTATASGFVSGEGPEKAVDGIVSAYVGGRNSKWCATGSGDKWLKVDLGEEYTINRWVVRHAEEGGESPSWNTRDFRLQMSTNGSDWKDVDTVINNTDSITNRVTNPFTTRYVRLYITKPTNTSDTASRIYEFELYADLDHLNQLTVNNGTGAGTYPEGSVVAVSATIPQGYIFKQWSGPVLDPYSYNTKVIMGAEPITLTAEMVKMGANVALNKTVTASGNVNDREGPEKAIDGLANTKWCHNTANFPNKWLAVDLGQEFTIYGWIVKHAGFGGESQGYNTRDFKLQISSDGIEWTDVDSVAGNTANITYRLLDTPFTARHARLLVSTPTNNSDPATRIYELELYTAPFSVNVAAANTILERNQSTGITLEAMLSEGESVDLTSDDMTIEYFSTSPDSIFVENGVATAKNVGTAEVYAAVTIDGIRVESNKISFVVTTSWASIKGLTDGFIESGNLFGPLASQLTNNLEQARKFYYDNKYDQAVKHMEDFLKHLNNPPMGNHISDHAKEILNLDANALIEIWKSIAAEFNVPTAEDQDSTVTDSSI